MSANKTYSLIPDDTIVDADGTTLTRIRAEKDFTLPYRGPDFPTVHVHKGDLGGYVENEVNLAHDGSWLDKTSVAKGLSYIHGQSHVGNHSIIEDQTEIHGRSRISESHLSDQSQIMGHTLAKNIHLSGNMQMENGTFSNPDRPGLSNDDGLPPSYSPQEENASPSNHAEENRGNFQIHHISNNDSPYGEEAVISIAQKHGDQIIYKECGHLTSNEDGSISLSFNRASLNEQNPVFTDSIDPQGNPDKFGDLAKSIRQHLEDRFQNEGVAPERIYMKWSSPNIDEPLPLVSLMPEASIGFMPFSRNEIPNLDDPMPILQANQQEGHLNVFDMRGIMDPSFLLEVPQQDPDFSSTTMMFKSDAGADLSGVRLFNHDPVPERINFVFSAQDRNDIRPTHENVLIGFPDLKPTIAQSGGNTSIQFMNKDLLHPEALYKSVGGPISTLEVPSEMSMRSLKAYAKKTPDMLARTIVSHQKPGSPQSAETLGWTELSPKKENNKEKDMGFTQPSFF